MFFRDYRRILVVGAGGGGDVVTAAVFALKLRRIGLDVLVAAPPWERVVVDPVPGPIGLDEIMKFVYKGDGYLVVDGRSYCMRGGRKFSFQASNVASALHEPIYVYSLKGGVASAYRGLLSICRDKNIDIVIGLDVGGDILAKGWEEDLWSPLADQLTLCSLYKLSNDSGVPSLVAVASPGADGELNRDYVIKLINDVVRSGGYVGSLGFDKWDIEIFERILSMAVSEAGKVILDALKGFVGWKIIRKGTRRVYVDALSTIVFLMDTDIVYSMSPLAEILLDTSSIDEANRILLEQGVPTEYELEREVVKLASDGDISGAIIRKARKNILGRLHKHK